MRRRCLQHLLTFVLLFPFLVADAQLSQPGRDSVRPDSLAVVVPGVLARDTNAAQIDSAAAPLVGIRSYHSITNDLLVGNKFINIKDPPVYFIVQNNHFKGEEFLFYLLCVVVFILGIFKTFYNSYFKNLFRVFFNTSLRQSQLTDQLLQATLPSFILNIFFSISAGIFCWLLLRRYNFQTSIQAPWLLPFCILAIALLYFLKYVVLKFIGWVTNMRETVDNYIFIIFLINKISGIVLIPFIIILAFSMPILVRYFTTISLLLLLLFFVSRYIKTYGVLQNKLPMNAFHFLVYVIATEIIPLLLLYKITMDYLI